MKLLLSDLARGGRGGALLSRGEEGFNDNPGSVLY